MAGTYDKSDPKRPASRDDWAPELTRLVNDPNRIGGRWVNQSDWFEYQGNARAFNRFLARYAHIATPPQLILSGGDGIAVRTPSGEPRRANYDWELAIVGWGRTGGEGISVTLPLNGSVKIRDIKVSASVSAGYLGAGQPDPDVKKLLHARSAKQAHNP